MGGHLLDQLLVHRVEVGVNKADGDRLHPLINELLDRARDIAKRFGNLPARHSRRQRAGHARCTGRVEGGLQGTNGQPRRTGNGHPHRRIPEPGLALARSELTAGYRSSVEPLFLAGGGGAHDRVDQAVALDGGVEARARGGTVADAVRQLHV